MATPPVIPYIITTFGGCPLPFSLRDLPQLLFALLALPLIWQDLKEYSVSLVLLVVVYSIWLSSTLIEGLGAGFGEGRLAASAIVLLIGALLIRLLPGRLGEADVIFMSGMAAIFPFWPLMIALALGCIAGLAAFLWLSREGGDEVFSRPLPLLPGLYWGGLTVILGGIRP